MISGEETIGAFFKCVLWAFMGVFFGAGRDDAISWETLAVW